MLDLATRREGFDFLSIYNDLVVFALAINRLDGALAGAGLTGVKAELATQRRELAHVVNQWATTPHGFDTMRYARLEIMIRSGKAEDALTARPVTALSSREQVALSQRSLESAGVQIDAMIRDGDLGPERCFPIVANLATASGSAQRVDRFERRRALAPTITAASKRLDVLAELLHSTPAKPWNLAYAQLFDTENELLRTIGTSKQRPYTGTIDPQRALEAIKPTSQAGDTKPTRAADPQTAVNLIAIGTRQIFEAQELALTHLKGDLEEPPPPKERSTFDTMLDLAMGLALGGVAGAIGGAIADKLKSSLEKGAKDAAKAVASDVARVASEATRKEVYEDTLARVVKSGAVYRAVAVDGAKDAAKALFKDSMSLALKGNPAKGVNSGVPRTAFFQQQQVILLAAKQLAEARLAHFASALAHLDLETLNELQLYIHGELVPKARDQMYDATLRSWLTFKATTNAKELATTGGAAYMPIRPVDGVLEARFQVDALSPLGHASPRSLTLRGGEPRAISHLKTAKHSLDKVGMYTRFRAEFSPKVSIELAVGPDFKLLQPGIVDLQQLKVIAAKDPMLDVFALSAIAGNYDHVSDADALRVGNQLVHNMAFISTAWLEEP